MSTFLIVTSQIILLP